MRQTAKILLLMMMVGLLGAGSVKAAMAGPHITLSPTSGTYNNGSTFKVVVGVDSGTQNSSAVDVWGTFDATKLEISSIEKSSNPAFPFSVTPNIYNDSGKFDFTCASDEMVSHEDKAIKGELVVITFKAKNTGTANLNFTCQSGSTVDSNIFNTSGDDIIDCSANQSGSYTIVAAAGGSNDSVDPTSTPRPTSSSTSSRQLPRTGGVGPTMGLVIFGAIGLLSAWFLKAL
jgi:hypothetical protein